MSLVKRFSLHNGKMHQDPHGPYCLAGDAAEREKTVMTAAQSELAALREELVTSKRNEHNSEVAYKAAIEKQEELRDRKNSIVDLQQRLTAAEQRNADTIAKLELAASMMDDDERGNRFAEVCRLAIAAIKPTESGASE